MEMTEITKKIRAKNFKRTIEYRKVLSQFVLSDEFDFLPRDVRDAIKHMSLRQPRGSVFSQVAKEIFPTVGSTIDEVELFKLTKFGSKEMNSKVRSALKKADPCDRMWIQEDGGVWTLMGVGEDPPESWRGWQPS